MAKDIYKVSSDSHIIFTFGNHICSLISMVTEVFLLWQTYLFLQMPMTSLAKDTSEVSSENHNILYFTTILIHLHPMIT